MHNICSYIILLGDIFQLALVIPSNYADIQEKLILLTQVSYNEYIWHLKFSI